MKKSSTVMGWGFSAPYLILATAFFLVPLIWAVFLSITNWNLISPNYEIVNFTNFITAIKNVRVQAAFVNGYKFMLILVPAIVTLSFLIAYTLYNLPKKLKPFFSVGFFIPYITSGVAISFVVRGIISYNSPIATFFREKMGTILDLNQSTTLAVTVIAIMVIWKMVGYYSLFILSNLENIPQDVHDAAKLDGVTGIKKIFTIVLPLIFPSIFTITTLTIGVCFSLFTEPYMLTGGGPNLTTNTWQLEVYTQSFVHSKSGYGAAVAILNAVVIFATLAIVQKLLKKWGKRYGWD